MTALRLAIVEIAIWGQTAETAKKNGASSAGSNASHHTIADTAAMNSTTRLLAAYDEQLRTGAETHGALAVSVLGPLHLASFARGRGFITYRGLPDTDDSSLRHLVVAALEHFRADPAITTLEWKSRAHDHAPGLHAALTDNGFVAGETESIMIGNAHQLALELPLPDGVVLRSITSDADVQRMTHMQAGVFGDVDPAAMAQELIERLARDDGMELWVAEVGGSIVCAGRLEPVAGTTFAGIWGGAARPEWRGKGIYRALTAARAKSAVAAGKTLIHSDSTAFSRPILERSGLLKVSETTPYVFTRAGA